MSTDDVQTNLRLPSKLKDRLQEVAKASGRTLTAEVVHRLEQSLGQLSVSRLEADSEVWEQLRTLRAQENALLHNRATLHRLREDLTANAPKDAAGNLTEEAKSTIWQIDRDLYSLEGDLQVMSKRMDDAYARASGMAPGAGRSWS